MSQFRVCQFAGASVGVDGSQMAKFLRNNRLMPVRWPYNAFCTEVGEDKIQLRNTVSVTVRGFSFAMVCGIKYSRPGSTSRTELMLADTCLILSMMVPSSLQKIILLCFPMISTIRRFFAQIPPAHLKCSSSNSKNTFQTRLLLQKTNAGRCQYAFLKAYRN